VEFAVPATLLLLSGCFFTFGTSEFLPLGGWIVDIMVTGKLSIYSKGETSLLTVPLSIDGAISHFLHCLTRWTTHWNVACMYYNFVYAFEGAKPVDGPLIFSWPRIINGPNSVFPVWISQHTINPLPSYVFCTKSDCAWTKFSPSVFDYGCNMQIHLLSAI